MKGESLEQRGDLRPDEVIADKVREMRRKEGGGQRPGQEGSSGRRGTSVSGAAQRLRKRRTESDQWIDKTGAMGDPD